MLRELVDRWRDRKPRLPRRHRRQPLSLAYRIRQILVVPVLQSGLVIEQILLRRAAEHVHVDGALCFRREVRKVRQAAKVLVRRGPRGAQPASRPNIVASAATPRPRGSPREKLPARLVENGVFEIGSHLYLVVVGPHPRDLCLAPLAGIGYWLRRLSTYVELLNCST